MKKRMQAKKYFGKLLVFSVIVFFMSVAFVTSVPAKEPIKIGFVSIFSGRVAMLGETGLKGAKLAVEEINSKGGVLGRKLEIISRDSGAKIEEAVRIAKEFVTKEHVNFLMDCSSSRESFAIKEVSRDLKVLTMVSASETTAHTANPKIWTKYTFRSSRQGIHDAVAAARFAAEMVDKYGLKKWASISPDYAYGRDSTATFFWALKKFRPDIEIVNQYWPKIFAPDYTSHITALLKDKPDAVYTALWGGDLVTFIEQGKLYGLFNKTKFFAINLADYPVLKAIKGIPEGMFSGSRYLKEVPSTELNKKFAEAYLKKYGELPTNWSQECYTGIYMLAEAVKRAGSLDTEKVIRALEGLTLKLPWGGPPNGTVTMRARDHTLINYAIAWGRTVNKPPYVVDLVFAPWDDILKYEKIWLKEKGWLK